MTQKITGLSVKNYKGVKEITLSPEGSSLVLIAGGNGAGKSSFIDAITEIFNPVGIRETPKPIRDGESEAVVEVTTTKARIVRKWRKNDAGSLDAYALDGAVYPSGKQFVLEATGGAIFDPKEFVSLRDKDQREQLLARVDLPFDLDELDRKRAGIFDERTAVNRNFKNLQGELVGRVKPDADTPTEEVSAADIIAEFEEARAHNADLQRAADLAAELDRHIDGIDRLIADLKAKLANATDERAGVVIRRDGALARSKASEPIDLDGISAKLAAVEETNAAIRAANEYRRVAAKVESVHQESEALTAELEAIDKQKADGLAGAKFPVDGLSVDESGITYQGIPFKQVNSAMQTAIAFDLATLPQPDLRLVVIKDGDNLDDNTVAEIERIADERGYLVLAERDRAHERQVSAHVVIDGVLA